MLLEKFINDLPNSLKVILSPGPVFSPEDWASALEYPVNQVTNDAR
jgi:hypothetical protein